ncbi:NAD(P)-binding Rossmann-fold superfamily protein [Quillaja saponaria]|uniref:NAD(P)-binding Rossmann-fold superfamily protein n=1 Tax=Quillaja saponaria TaxID=32244 RepID=A0AAD7VLI6_QUISA|nr:NAD(P)-binding Rossmann-fold superfamily protein [Quillaja saponaria]
METTACFTTISVCWPQKRIGHFSNVSNCTGFLSSNPSKSLSSSLFKNSIFGTRVSSLMATNLQVSGNAPIEDLGSSSSGLIGEHDLLIVGPGVLGRLVAEKWREEHPGCQIYGQTVTTDHHDELIKMGITPSLKETNARHKFPYVIFCAPPSRTSDYPGDVSVAATSWNGEGSFLFTSSSAPYDCNDNGPCDEETPVVPIGRSPRTDVLLKAEKVVLEFGGCVLRLAGLYKAGRGAHAYWLDKGTVETRPDHILNLIHYEDAASLSVVILKKKLRGRIFLGCDNHPLSRQEVMDLVNRSEKFSKKFEKFTGTDGPLGKRLNNSRTREELGWEPKYGSFAEFLEKI